MSQLLKHSQPLKTPFCSAAVPAPVFAEHLENLPKPVSTSSFLPNSKTSQSAAASRTKAAASIFTYFPNITTHSRSMQHILGEARKFATSSNCVLIQGESGTGKELMASSLHRLSKRYKGPYVTMNCSAINEGLLESELFGHVKGAFTGATRHKEGFFAKAEGGTIFLDEIGDMPIRLQAKLLRVLQNNAYHPVGSTDLKTTDVRIIAATNVDLAEAIKRKRFRLDLYYRLNVLPIELPPLRRRIEDIDLLVDHFIEKLNIENHTQCYMTPACIERLKLYPWPGNVRELENVIKRLVITKQSGALDISDLPNKYLHKELFPLREGASLDTQEIKNGHLFFQPDRNATTTNTSSQEKSGYVLSEIIQDITLPSSGIQMSDNFKKLEEHLIQCALSMTGNNKNQAACLLGIKRTTLIEKMKRHHFAGSQKHAFSSNIA